MTSRDVLFSLFGLLAAGGALLAVTTRQVVHAALWLVVTLGSLAGCFLALGAEVVALVQVLVYVGAVVVLVLFALMLTRAPIGRSPDVDGPRGQRLAAGLAGLATAGLLAWALLTSWRDQAVAVDAAHGSAQPLARSLFGSWVLPFELLSVLLLAALVAAVALARGSSPTEPTLEPVAEKERA